ncbi:MAG: DUF1398 family protein [Enterococcus sp.]
MLDYQKIEQAINRETTAGDFAKLMQEFQQLGVIAYDYLVAEGLYRYHDADSFIDLQMNGIPTSVTNQGDREKIKQAVTKAQASQITFTEFCELAGKAGISYWQTDILAKTVTYYDLADKALLIEPIPGI